MMDWISVEDRLPEYAEDVLVYFSGGGIVPPRVAKTCRLYNMGFLLESVYGPVTHWMPLPDPPKGVNQHEH